jgi:hypothetical protein
MEYESEREKRRKESELTVRPRDDVAVRSPDRAAEARLPEDSEENRALEYIAKTYDLEDIVEARAVAAKIARIVIEKSQEGAKVLFEKADGTRSQLMIIVDGAA